MSVRLDEVPLARPVLGDAEERAVIDVLRSGQLSLGPRVPAFERAFAARLGVAHACATPRRAACATATRS
ncbi:MAG TPA: DegT/DnrJ/EryC1/StrS family aminotransferase [Solirubrobacteraceae bacterium]|nr:DegT/DnrJ/EryC1/StrS family aminotransferase [Solirubrobacteraceae bacterium]